MVLRTNIAAMQAYRNFGMHQQMASRAMLRISSGYRINSAADNPAGLAISERMRGQIRGLKMASRNTQNAISMLQVAEGGLNETTAILQRMRELAVQASNGTFTEEDRKNLNLEYQALLDEVDRIARYTNYNGIKLLDGSSGGKTGKESLSDVGLSAENFAYDGSITGTARLHLQEQEDGGVLFVIQAGEKTQSKKLEKEDTEVVFDLGSGDSLTISGLDAEKIKNGVINNIKLDETGINFSGAVTSTDNTNLTFQVGANGGQDDRIGIHLSDLSTASLGPGGEGGLLRDTDILTVDNANKAIDYIERATSQVTRARAGIGAQINRMEFTVRSLDNTAENLTAAESAIRDADIAEEMMNYVKYSILMQAAQAMMAQAMQMPQGILQLLKSL